MLQALRFQAVTQRNHSKTNPMRMSD